MPTVYEDLSEDFMGILDMSSLVKITNDFMAELDADIEKWEKSHVTRPVRVKSEKPSDEGSAKPVRTTRATTKLVSVKKEQMEMPPPVEPVRKGKPRKVKGKPPAPEVEPTRETDVFIHPTQVTVINLDDSHEDENKENKVEKEEVPVRSTRTKTRAQANKIKVEKLDVDETQTGRSTRTKTRTKVVKDQENGPEGSGKRFNTSSPIANNKRQKSIEVAKNADATFDKLPAKPANETYVKPLDSTITLNKPDDVNTTYTLPTLGLKNPPDQATTLWNEPTFTKTPQNKTYNKNDLFTDDDDDDLPLKQAKPGKPIFNTYGTSPVKARVKAFEKLQTASASKKIPVLKPTTGTKLKTFQPFSPAISKAPSSALKGVLPPKTASAIKAYQQDYIDRELKQKARERELQHQQLGKGPNGLVKTKQEGHAAKPPVGSAKPKQEAPRKEAAKGGGATPKPHAAKLPKQGKPLFLDVSAPMLPVNDCYDSDDERGARRAPAPRPNWTRRERMCAAARRIAFYGPTVTNTLFMCRPVTVDLASLFGNTLSKKLVRSSSAVWTKPPRFTLMPIHSDDEDL